MNPNDTAASTNSILRPGARPNRLAAALMAGSHLTAAALAFAFVTAVAWTSGASFAHATGSAEAADTQYEPRTAAERMIQAVADELIDIAGDDALDADTKRVRIEETLYEKAHFATISKLVLARNYSKFTEPQRADFQKEFRSYLSTTYGKNIDTYTTGDKSVDDAEMVLLGSRDEARGDVTVHSKIVRKGEPDVLVDYRMRQFDGEWKIIDVIAEGISMISNLRSQFQEIISASGPDGLLDKLREKNAST